MARWKPSSEIAKSEPVGRRLFDEPLLAGVEVSSRKKFEGVELRHFEEPRDRELSLDRLGRGTIEKSVVNYLLPRARDAGQKFHSPQTFNGWYVLKVRELEEPRIGKKYKMPVVASQIPGIEPEDLVENHFHAHAILPEAAEPYDVAMHLKNIFTRYGDVHTVEALAVLPTPFWHRFLPVWAWLELRLQRLRA